MSSAISQRDDLLGSIVQVGDKERLRGGKKKIKKKEKSKLDIHFETVIILLRLKTSTYEKSLFLFIVLNLLMIITNMNNYLLLVKGNYPNISQSSAAFSLMNSLKYLDVSQILGFAGSQSVAITICISIYMIFMTFLYGVCYFEKFQNPKKKPRKYFYGRWFVNMADFFQQILFFPFNVIFLSFIVCNQENSSSTNCNFSSGSYYTLALIFALVGFIFSLFNEWWMQIFFYNTKIYKKDATNIDKEASFLLEISVCRLIIVIFTTVRDSNNYGFFMAFIIIQTLAFFYLYIRNTFTQASFTFANSNIRSAYQYGIIIFLAQHCAFVADEIARQSLFYSSESEKFIQFFFFFCAIISAVTYKAKELQMRRILFSSTELQKLSSNQLFYKISLFQSLNSQTSSNIFYDTIYKGFINEHTENPCMHPNEIESCFCKQKILYDPKKRKDTPIDKLYLTQNNSVFTKFMVKSWYETYLSLHQQDYINYLYYSEFLYFKMKNVSLALKNLAILENKYLTPVQKYRLFRLKHIILKHNRKRNHDSYRVNQSDKDNRNKLEIETVIPIEEQISQIQNGIKFIIKNNIRFWAYLEKQNINLNEINQLAKFSLKQLDELKKLWKDSMYYLDYRKKWRFYYCWYYLYVLNRKIKVSMLERFSGISNVNENDVFSEELVQDNMDDDVLSVHSNMKADEMEKIYVKNVEMAFDKKSVIFHVNHEYKGKILKVNRALYHGFGYTSMDLVGNVYISQLMPRIYQNLHPQLMKGFAQTGKTKTLYSQRKIFCLNKQGYLFAAWKFVKQYVTITNKCEYVALIRPITPPAGTKIYYLIMNDDWEIDSMSEGLYEGFSMSSKDYQNSALKQLLNILILSPKLIRFSKFAKYLTESDFKIFQHREYAEKRKQMQQQQGRTSAIARYSILAKIRKEQNQFLVQDSFGMNSPRESSYIESESPGLTNQHSMTPLVVNNNPQPKPLSTFSQMYSQQQSIRNNPIQQSEGQSPKRGDNKQNESPKRGENKDKESPKNNSHANSNNLEHQTKQSPINRLSFSIAQNTPNVLAPNSVGPRKLLKKRTLIINSEDNDQKNKNQNGDEGTPRQLLKDVTKDSLSVASGDNTNQRRNSNQEIMEQLNYAQTMQMDTNNLRQQILKKKQSIHVQKELLESNTDDADAQSEQEKSDYEAESEEDLEQFEEGANEFLKLDNLERGESMNFRIRIPMNLNELMLEYNQQINSIPQRRASRMDLSQTMPAKTSKFLKSNIHFGDQVSNYALESHDKSVYNIIKEMFLKYQTKKRSLREYNGQCTASFKKTGKQKIIIMKFIKFEELARKKATKALHKQVTGSDQDAGKKLLSFVSGQFDGFAKQQSITETNPKQNNFISMRSEVSDAQQSVVSNTYVGNKFQRHGEQIHTDTEDYGGTPQIKKEEELNLGKTNGMGYQLKMISEQDENAPMSERTLKTFHKDFINRQGARNISLSQNDNIYIKEDNHKPNKNIKTIQNMKIFVRLFFLCLIALNTFTFFYGPNQQFPVLRKQSNKIFQAENVLLSALQAYNLLLGQIMLNNNYFSTALSSNQFWNASSFQTLISQELMNETDYFYSINSDTNYKQTFYDRSITPYSEYNKPLFTGSNVPSDLQSQKYTLDIYDLFSEVIFSLQTIEETKPIDITLSYTPVEFFRQNIFPYLYNGLRQAQDNLVSNLKDTTNSVYFFLIIIIIVESVMLFSSFIALFYLIYVICNAFKSVIEVFPKISQRDLTKIKNYNINLNQNFSYIVEKDDILSGTHPIYQNISAKNAMITGGGRNGTEVDGTENGKIQKKNSHNFDLEEPNDGNENVGKKSKNIEDGGFLSKLKMNIFAYFAAFVIIVAIFSCIFLFLIMQSTTNLQKILDNGDVIMNQFGDNIVIMIAMKEKKLDSTNYNSVFKPTIQNLIDTYNSQNLQPTVDNLTFLTFDDVFNTIFYSNPCSALSAQIIAAQANLKECATVAQGSLVNGVASFNSFYKNAVFNYVNNVAGYSNLDNSVVFDYDRGISFVDIFQVYLIQVWSDNTDNYLSGQLTILIIFISAMLFVLLIVYLIITERFLIGRFNSEYAYFRTIYNMYMPDIIILKEKRIKFYLVKHSILNK